MQQGEIVLRLLIPPHQNAPEPVHPAMTAFNDPPSCPLARLRLELLGRRTPRFDMRGEAELFQNLAHFVVVVPFVQSQPLRRFFGCVWPLHSDALDGGPHQLHIMPVGAINRQSNRHPMPLRQQAALDPAFAAIGGIAPGFFPRPVAPWSSPHPYSARSSRCPVVHRTAPGRFATASGRPLRRPIPESDHGRWIWRTSRFASRLPIVSRCEAHITSRRHSGGPARVAARRQSGGYSRAGAAAVPGPPTVHRKCESRSLCGCWTCALGCASMMLIRSCP